MSFHGCNYDGSMRFIRPLDSRFPATVAVFALINYFCLSNENAIPETIKFRQEEPSRIFSLAVSRAFNSSNVIPPPGTEWSNLMGENAIIPNYRGSPTEFTRQQGEQEADSLLFSLCELLDIKLCHGWIENPNDPDDTGERQLTRYGLECLTNEISEGKLALLFRNGCINVVHKREGSLYLLETDKGTLEKRPGSVWRTLTVHEHEEILFTSAFTPIDLSLQPNSEVEAVVKYMNQWNAEMSRSCSVVIDKFTKHQSENSPKTSGSTSGNKKPTAAKVSETPSTGRMDDEYQWAKESFKGFLNRFYDEEDDSPVRMPFYVRMVEGWKGLKPIHIPYSAIIYYPHVLSWDETLALAILNNHTRLHEVLSQVFLDFRVNQNCGTKKELKGKVKIRVLGMPPAGSTCKFEDFLESSKAKLAEPHTSYDGTILNSTTYIGRRAGKGYVDDILENHKRKKSWNGNFSKSDLGIKDGRFQILKLATEDASISSMSADFVKLTELLFEHYTTDSSKQAPEYFDVFQNEVFNMENQFTDIDINSVDFKVFQRYLSHHLAFKAPRVRAGLFLDIWGDIQCLRAILANGRRAPFTRLQTRWKEITKIRDKFKENIFFNKVYCFDNFYLGNDKYDRCYLIHLLELIRHLEMHLHDHTRNAKGEQLLTDTILVDLLIEKTLHNSVSELVYAMMLELNDSPFSRSWEHYEMFECGNDLQNTASEGGKGEKVQSGDMGSSTSEKGDAKDGVENSGSGSGGAKGFASEAGDGMNEELHE